MTVLRRGRRGWIVMGGGAVLALFVLAGWMLWGRGGRVVRRQFAVPVSLGDRVVTSGMVIECDVEPMDVSLEAWRRWHAGALKRRVAALVEALRTGDEETVGAICKSDGLNTPKAVCGMMKRTLEGVEADLSNLRMRGRIFWGRRHIFVYEAPGRQSPFIGFLTFEREAGKGWVWVTLQDGLVLGLWSMVRQDRLFEQWHEEQVLKGGYGYRFRVAGQDGRRPVELLFNGRPCEVEVPGEAPEGWENTDDAAVFYAGVQRAIANADGIEAFREIGRYYEEYSSKKFLRWLETPDDNDVLRQEAGRERTILFVLEAEPVFIVFSRPKGWPKDHIQRAYLVRQDERFYVTRLGFSDDLSDFFGNREKFLEPFFMGLAFEAVPED